MVPQKPQKLRQMLEQHGAVSRVYLAPEGASLLALSNVCPCQN